MKKKQTINSKEKASVSNRHRGKTNSSAGEKPNKISMANDDEIDGSKPIGKAHGRLNDVHEGNREKYDKSLKEIHE